MKLTDLDLQSLLTVAIATLDTKGLLIEANAGFLRLLPADGAQRIGTPIGRYFIQPSFAQLLTAADAAADEGYRGIMTIGDPMATMRTLLGRFRRTPAGLELIAEHDIVALEKLGNTLLDLQQEAALSERSLTRANLNLRQREAQILEASLTDALTGIGNRRKLEQALGVEIDRAHRSGAPLSAIMVDIDHFKRVNDDFGHGGGDKVLTVLGALLASRTRSTDVAARFGGEEFVVLLPNAGLANAVLRAEQLRVDLAAQIIPPLTRLVTGSFGVAELAPGENGESLLRRADAALYQAKQSGRNQVCAASGSSPAVVAAT